MENLIKIENISGVQVVDSRLIAKGLGIKHKNLLETIKKYQTQIEKLGVVPFETEQPIKESQGGRPEVFCYLNEIQCNFVVTLSRNTEAVVNFKLGLVLAFDQAKKQVALLESVLESSGDLLAKKRLFYKKQGYSDNWIEKRLKSLEVRSELESEWRKRRVQDAKQFAILTAIISKGTFGITPTAHKKLKGLKSQNLRDHMTFRELAFMILAEISTMDFTESSNAQDYEENKKAAQKGGELAGEQRELYEKRTGKKVLSSANFLTANKAKYIQK